MSIENLFLTQQQQETQRNYERQLEKEQKRRERGGLFSSIGGGLGGFLGALALAPFTGGASLLGSAALGSAALTGLGATAGSLIGSRAGLELGGGRRSDAVDLGMNRDALTGDLKEFSQSVKDRYNRGIDSFQDALNNRILSSALTTGIKAAGFNYGQNLLNPPVTNAVMNAPEANIAGAQAYQPSSLQPSSLSRASQMLKGQLPSGMAPPPNNLLNLSSAGASSTGVNLGANVGNIVPSPIPSAQGIPVSNIFSPYIDTGTMSGMGPLSNQAYSQASAMSNPFLPSYLTQGGS
mgnify:CR=1 FL=1|tara:strand:- start:4257 stop:5138 length:882 start_codon:yes stop_codon:yes gene_type:complete